MENLFSDDPQFRRVQYKKLSDNVREWQQEVAALVSETLPRDLSVDVTVVFQQVDDEKGYAVGTAIAKEQGTGKQIGIPIIVKSWHLAPIDLFFSEGKLYPISEDNLAKVFYQNSLGAGIAPQKPPAGMVDDVYSEMRNPPLGGKYSYSAPFSFLRLISGTLGASDLRLFKEAALKNPHVLAGYQKRGNFDLLCKFAQEKPQPDQQDDINKDRAQTVLTIKKDGPDNYRLYSATDEVYDPVMISTNRRGARDMLGLMKAELVDFEKDPMLVADQNGFVTITAPESPYGKDVDVKIPAEIALGEHKNPFVFDPMQSDRTAANIDSFGRFGVRDRDGVLAKGWVVPNVVNFDGSKASNKLFLGKAMAAYQGRIAGIPLDDDDDTNLVHDRPDAGKIGVLVYREGKDVFATVPFQVTGVTVYKNLRSLAIVDVSGKLINLIISPTINGIVKISESTAKPELGPLLGPKDNYFVSAKLFFVRMPRMCPVSESPEDFKRIAAEWLDHNPIKVAMQNGRYVFRGARLKKLAGAVQGKHSSGLDKIAFDFNSLSRHEAEFLLASWGLPLIKCAEVLDGVKTRIALDLHHLRVPGLPDGVKTAAPASATLARSIKAPIADLVKIAANLEDAQTVDSVLSLGFVNPDNVSRFASAKSMLWEVSHMLAKLLLAARLGMEDLPEESIRSAITHLQRIIDGLDRLKMLEDEQTKSAAAKPSTPRHVGGRLVGSGGPVGFTR
jgi:hypothetical protein